MKQGRIDLDLALDLWLLGHFNLRIFRLSHWTMKPSPFSYSGNSGLKEIA